MKLRIFPILLILVILTIGVIGFLGFSSVDHTGQHNCPIALMSGGDCFSVMGSMALAFHHIAGMQSLSQYIINFDSFLLLFLAFLVVVSLLIYQKFLRELSISRFIFCPQHRRAVALLSTIRQSFLHWLAIHYKRGPDLFYVGV